MYKLPNLPFLYQDLEPFIDTHTMALHHEKHEQNYVNNLNKLLDKNQYDYQYKMEELIYRINMFTNEDQENILFNLRGVLNHELYWRGMKAGGGNKPVGKLKEQIERKFGNYENFWSKIKSKALELKGSGYTFLVLKTDGSIDIINMQNQETPLLLGYIPLFNIDLWEHAYYINYENDKGKYLNNFKQIVDFTYASSLFNEIVI